MSEHNTVGRTTSCLRRYGHDYLSFKRLRQIYVMTQRNTAAR